MALIGRLLVIVEVIHQFHISPVETENYSPIAVNPDGVKPLQVPAQRMKMPAGRGYIFRLCSDIQSSQLQAQLRGMVWLNTCLRAAPKERLQSPVPEAFDHGGV